MRKDVQAAKARHERLDGPDKFGAARRGGNRAVAFVKKRETELGLQVAQQARNLGQVKVQNNGGARQTLRARGDGKHFPCLKIVDGSHGFAFGSNFPESGAQPPDCSAADRTVRMRRAESTGSAMRMRRFAQSFVRGTARAFG